MGSLSRKEVTSILKAWNLGNEQVLEDLIPLVYDELHRLAHLYMSRESPGGVLQTTALINETYLKINQLNQIEWKSRSHFIGVAARLMRRILVDFARNRKAKKRGGDFKQVTLDDGLKKPDLVNRDLEALDSALNSLAQQDKRKAKVVELRYFGGFSVRETADVLEISPETVHRDWNFAKAWLLRELAN